MSTKAIVTGAVIYAVLSGCAVRASEAPPVESLVQAPPEKLPAPAGGVAPPPVASPVAPPAPLFAPPNTPAPAGAVADPLATYGVAGLPIGGNGPIGSDFYWRNGISMPVLNGILGETLQAGWMTDFGARALFFNPSRDAAWTAAAGVSYTYNNSSRGDRVFTTPEGINRQEFDQDAGVVRTVFRTLDIPVTIRDYQRWSFNVAWGREWYLAGPAVTNAWNLRFGGDVGGRYGYGRAGLNDLTGIVPPDDPSGLESQIYYRHKSDVFGAAFLSLHTDVEAPIRGTAAVFVTGFRAEWNYTWTDIFPTQQHDLQDVNLLWTIGFRY